MEQKTIKRVLSLTSCLLLVILGHTKRSIPLFCNTGVISGGTMLVLHFVLSLHLALGAPHIRSSPQTDDPFYSIPSHIDSYSPGEIIESRSTYTHLILGAKTAFNLKYSTTNNTNQSSYAVNTIYTPENPKFPQKIVCVLPWEDSVSESCAPSYTLEQGLSSPNAFTVVLDSAIAIDWALAQGYYVTVPDFEGPNSDYFVGRTAGYAGLDGIRATKSYLDLPNDASIVLYGYSGGAQAAAWISNLHESYASELNIVGSATGGNLVDIGLEVDLLRDTQFSSILAPILNGLLNGYPSQAAQIYPHLDQSANNTFEILRSGNFCFPEILSMPQNGNFFSENDLGPDYLNYPPLADILARESLLSNASSMTVSVPNFPRYIYHASGDELASYPATKLFTEQQCAMGADINFVTIPIGEHISTIVFGLPGAIQFLDQALNGKTPSVKCGTSSRDTINITSPNVDDVIGSGTANRIRSYRGKDTPLGKINW